MFVLVFPRGHPQTYGGGFLPLLAMLERIAISSGFQRYFLGETPFGLVI